MWVWVLAAAAALAVFYLVPDLLAHLLQVGGFAADSREPRVALTFDDGPGPDTAAILDILKAGGARATFFVLGEMAQRYPELVRRMVDEGHDVGLHGWTHRSSWTLTPWGSWWQLTRGRAIVQSLTGRAPRWYRPPWGQHNLVTWLAPARLGMRRALWSVAPDDWRPDRSAAAIAEHVLRHALPGAVVVLHDGGGDRGRTAAALPRILEGLRVLALEPVSLSAMQEERSWIHRLWFWREELFTRQGGIDTLPASDGGPPVLRVGLARYSGPELRTADGRVIPPGVPLAELHLYNVTVGMDSETPARIVHAFQRVHRAMGDAARFIRQDPRYRACRLVGGLTVLDAGAAIARMGFNRTPARGLRMWGMRLYLVFLMAIFHRQGFRVFRRLPRLKPVWVWMEVEPFLERFDPPDRPHVRSRRRTDASGESAAAHATMSSENTDAGSGPA